MRFTLTLLAFVALSMTLVSAAPTDPAMMIRRELAASVEYNKALASRSSTSASSFSSNSYDYIVVGAGTAGLAVAARLSQSGKYSVGVLEAGPDGEGDSIIDIPGEFGADLGTKYDWNYTSEASGGIPSIALPRGHVVGGSSALNFLVWDSASEFEYNSIEQLGNPGWNWANMSKYMRKSENFHEPSESDQAKLHMDVQSSDYGANGPVQVTYPRYISKQVRSWIPALNSLGLSTNNKPGDGVTEGASNQPADINPANWTRSYSAPAYYYPNSGRSNLALLANAKVSKINFSSKKTSSGDITATGVSFNYGGSSYTVNANKEVIVSGGAFNSPQLLELSGIGGKTLLNSLGIDVLIDNANVGENLQDHTYSFAAFELKSGTNTLDALRWNDTFIAEQKALYAANKPSILEETVPSISYAPLDVVAGSSGTAYLKSLAPAAAAANDGSTAAKTTLALQLEHLYTASDELTYEELIGVDGYFAGVGTPATDVNYVTFLNANQHNFGRGSVHITSSDVDTYPTIAANYYNNEFDRKLAVYGIKMLRKIAAASPYSEYISQEVVPGTNYTTDAELESFVTQHFATEYHNIATCSMLPKASGGVVDSDLVVYGTSNVRVVDLSIWPLHISAHTQRTAYGIGEFGADIILGQA